MSSRDGRLVPRFVLIPGLLALSLLTAAPARPDGFSGPDPGIKAMGMAGAFIAQASDPSAIYYNPGGLALQKKGKLTAGGGTVYHNESQYQGLPPGIGQGTTGAQDKFETWPLHAYAVKPLGKTLKLGLGVSSPYGFKTRWANAHDTFPGRFISTASELQSYDSSATLSWMATPNLGLGASVVYRTSKLSQSRNLSAFNPSTGLPADVASINADTDFNGGLGWQAGLLQKIGKQFSWGLVYRSPIKITQTGAGRLTQISTGDTQVDALNRATIPYDKDLPISSLLNYPATAGLGVAYGLSGTILVEGDVNWTGWSRFKGLSISFPLNPQYSNTLQAAWKDSMAYRLGLRLALPKGMQLRFGYAYEDTPQPDAGLSPFLPDARRSIFSAGFGRDWLDIAFQYIAPQSRVTRTNADSLNGSYSGNAYILGVSVSK
jgi:long-chain fatty acid transport protein